MDDEQRQHLQNLLRTHRRRLQELEQQVAVFGIAAPAHLRTESDEIRREIASITGQLGTAPRVLPAPVLDFIGREAEISQLVSALD